MGGIGSGGHAAVGRKPKGDLEAFVQGKTRTRVTKALPKAVEMPDDLPAEQQATWRELAPHAVLARTLTDGTISAFRDLCEAIVLKRSMLARIESDGLTYLKVTVDGSGQEHSELKAHPLISQHRGMMQRVEAGMTRFKLAPIGKEIVQPEPEVDPFAEFEDGAVQ